MKKSIAYIGGASALLIATVANVASAQYSTPDFQTSTGTGSSGVAANDFVSNLQLGSAPSDRSSAPIYNSGGSVTLEGTSNNSGVLGLIDTSGGGATGGALVGNGNGIYGDTDAILKFNLVTVGNVAYTTFGLGERVTGGGANGVLTSPAANTYPAYVVYFDLGTLSLVQNQDNYSGYSTLSLASAAVTLTAGDSYQLEMSTIGSTSPTVTAVLTDLTSNTVTTLTGTGSLLAKSGAAGSADTQGSVGFYGGSDGSGNYNTLHGINATSFSVNESSSPVPEPASVGLLAIGAVGLLARRRARKAM